MCDKSGEGIFNEAIGAVNRAELDAAKEATREAAHKFLDQGFDEEEVVALLMGAMEQTSNYIPGMGRFFELQIRRAVKSVLAVRMKR